MADKAIADGSGHKTMSVIMHAANARELEQGKRNDITELSNNITKLDRGTSVDYLTARIKRDHPEIHERMLEQEGGAGLICT